MLTLIILVLLIAFLLGAFGTPRWGYYGWSPLVVILIILLVLYLMGHRIAW